MGNMNWKAVERKVAKKLGCKRLSRGMNFSLMLPDAISNRLIVEIKSGKQIPKFFANALKQCRRYKKDFPNRVPVVVMKPKGMRGEIAMLTVDDLAKLMGVKK